MCSSLCVRFDTNTDSIALYCIVYTHQHHHECFGFSVALFIGFALVKHVHDAIELCVICIANPFMFVYRQDVSVYSHASHFWEQKSVNKDQRHKNI